MKTREDRVTLFGRLMHSNSPNIISLVWILGTAGEKTRCNCHLLLGELILILKATIPADEVALFWCTTSIVLCFSSGNTKS